jgi:hypothetical protein
MIASADITLAALLAPHVPAAPGTVRGICYLCGGATDAGYAEPPSDNFTAWASCYGGAVLCPLCRAVLHDRRFRATSWLATTAGVRFATRDDRLWLWQALVDPPAPPFALYITRGAQKQGWLTLTRYVSTSQAHYWVGTDWTDRPVPCAQPWMVQHALLVTRLRERGLSKTALCDGAYTMKHYERAIAEGWRPDLDAARALAGDPRWQVLVHVSA